MSLEETKVAGSAWKRQRWLDQPGRDKDGWISLEEIKVAGSAWKRQRW